MTSVPNLVKVSNDLIDDDCVEIVVNIVVVVVDNWVVTVKVLK